MARSERRGLWWRVLPLVLLVPLVVVPTVAMLLAFGGGGSTSVPIAAGSSGGAFHPVAGGFVADATALADCAGSYSCLEQAFGNIAFERGPKRALAVFETELVRDKDVERDCHRIVHTIGSATYARYDGDVARTFSEGSSTCASGYYHGILERAFVGITSKAELGKAARELCLGVGIRRQSFLDYQCRHGLGHGFMIQTGYDLPTALSLCSGLGTGWDRVTCTSGSFMENVSTRFGYRSSWLDEEDPLYPCNRVAVQHRRSCYVRATTWILQVEKNDFRRTADRCVAAGRWAAVCFRGFGRDAVVEARYRDFRRGSRAVHPVRPVRGRLLLRCGADVQRRGGPGGCPARSSLLRHRLPRCTARTARADTASWSASCSRRRRHAAAPARGSRAPRGRVCRVGRGRGGSERSQRVGVETPRTGSPLLGDSPNNERDALGRAGDAPACDRRRPGGVRAGRRRARVRRPE